MRGHHLSRSYLIVIIHPPRCTVCAYTEPMHLEGTPHPRDGQLLCREDGVNKGAALLAPAPAVQGESVPDSAPAAKCRLEIWTDMSVL